MTGDHFYPISDHLIGKKRAGRAEGKDGRTGDRGSKTKPMSTQEHESIDFVTLDPKRDVVVLVMVENRPWGGRGMLLPDFEAKLNTYFSYVTTNNLVRDYPQVAGKKVEFQLRCAYPPGEREDTFIEIVTRRHLEAAGIGFSRQPIGASVA